VPETTLSHASATETVRGWITSGTRVCITVEVSGVVLLHACGVLNKPVRWDPDEEDLVLEALLGLQEPNDALDYTRSFHPTEPGRYAIGYATTFGEGIAFNYRPTRSWVRRVLRVSPKVRVIVFPLRESDWPEGE
jgi:hypothetical protein